MRMNLFIRIAISVPVAFALCIFAFAASADLTLSVGEADGCSGDAVSVPVSIINNVSGFGGVEFSVAFDSSVLTLVSIDTEGAIADFTVTPTDIANANGRVDFTYVNYELSNIIGDGEIAVLNFKVAKNAEVGEEPLLVSVPENVAFFYEGRDMADLSVASAGGAVNVCPDALDMLVGLGIQIPDYSGDYSAPIKKYQLAVLLAQAMSGDAGLETWNESPTSDFFVDVNKYGTAIDYVYNHNIVSGSDESNFGINKTVLYQDALVVAVRILGYETEDMQYPYGYILAAERLGLVFDDGIGYDSELTVEDTARLVWNMLNTVLAITDPIADEVVYPDQISMWETLTGNHIERCTLAELVFYGTHNCTFGDWIVRTPATPYKDGEKYRVCFVCKEEETAVIQMTGMTDIDGDGELGVLDILLVVRAAVEDTYLPVADINGDGKITLFDVLEVVRFVTE